MFFNTNCFNCFINNQAKRQSQSLREMIFVIESQSIFYFIEYFYCTPLLVAIYTQKRQLSAQLYCQYVAKYGLVISGVVFCSQHTSITVASTCSLWTGGSSRNLLVIQPAYITCGQWPVVWLTYSPSYVPVDYQSKGRHAQDTVSVLTYVELWQTSFSSGCIALQVYFISDLT